MKPSRRSARQDVASTLRYHSEERFRLLVESVKDYAIFMLDTEGRVASWNAGAERITGYAAAEVVGMDVGRFYTDEARETHWPEQALAQAAREGRAEDEGWRLGKGGERFWAHTVITALRDADGALRGYATTFRDLSDRRRQEEQIARNEERLRALLASVRDYAIIMLDPDGTIVSWSEGAELIEGYRAEEIIGAHFSRFFPPEAIERGWPEHELRVAATEGRFEDENWRIRKDGSRYWANVVVTALRDPNSRLIGFSKIMRDLTERRHQEQTLRESQERFRLLIESVEEYAIHMLDAGGQLMSWNAGSQQLFGFDSAEILGKHFSRFYLPEEIHAGRPWQQLEAARQQGRLQLEGLRVRQDGTAFSAQVLIAPVHDSEGRLRGFSHVVHDLTRLRHMRALEDSGRRMNEFLAVLGHELRDPLAPLRHAAGLLRQRPMPDSQLDRLAGIVDHQVAHLTRVVDELLDVSRVVHGLVSLSRERVEIATVIERALEMVAPLIESRAQQLQVSPYDAALAVDADVVRMTQVLVTLLDNAARYTPERGELQLEVRRAGSELQLTVRDNGRGIAPERLGSLFDFFAHAGRDPASGEGGLGVGLGLARRLIELHGGRIQAYSQGVGQGAQFTVTLPLWTGPRAAAVSTPRTAPVGVRKAHRILVVDDNVDSALSLVMLLQSMGYEARSAHDGVRALQLAQEFDPDTVLLDIGLPRLDGYEVARRLRAQPNQHYLLIAVTGWGQTQDRERARAAGFDQFLVKPVDLERLGALLGSAPGSPQPSSDRP